MSRPFAFASLLLASTLTASARGSDPQEVRGRVLTADGRPAAAVEVAPYWVSNESGLRAYGAATTDANGAFRLKTTIYGGDRTLLAMDRSRQLVGITQPGAPGRTLEIRLTPGIRLHGSFSCKELGRAVTGTNVWLTAIPAPLPFIDCGSQTGTFLFLVPPGRYKLRADGAEIAAYRSELTLSADRPDMDLGMIDVRANAIAKYKGKAPPALTVTDARGVPKTVRLEDFKGKWVLLEFWGYW